MVILILRELTPQMHAMVEQLLCLIVLIGLRATHGMDVMDSLFAQTARYVIYSFYFSIQFHTARLLRPAYHLEHFIELRSYVYAFMSQCFRIFYSSSFSFSN